MSSVSSEEEEVENQRRVGNAFSGLMLDSDSDDSDEIGNVSNDNTVGSVGDMQGDDNFCTEDDLLSTDEDEKKQDAQTNCISEFDDIVGKSTRHGTTFQTDFVDSIKQLIGDEHSKPTKIQCECWTTMLSPLTRDRDVIAISKTGSGKTLGFLVPLLSSLTAHKLKQKKKNDGAIVYPRAVIIAPTRVLAQQIFEIASILLTNTSSLSEVKLSMALGGCAYHQQIADILSTDPDLIIATPGRLNSLCGHVKGSAVTQEQVEMCIKLDEIFDIVIDEADMMLDLGFENDISLFANLVNTDSAFGYRLVLTSATWEEETSTKMLQFESISQQDPVFLTTDAGHAVTKNVSQLVEVLAHKGAPRFKYLCKLLTSALGDNLGSRIIVFCLHKSQTRQMGKDLQAKDIENIVLEGDMSQSARVAAIEAFRNGTQGRVLVATDVAARGLDVLSVSHVFNYSLGISIDSYIHRCGRTGRAGQFGVARTFVVKGDEKLSPELCVVLQKSNQFVPDDLRIMAGKEMKKRTRAPIIPKDEDAIELQEVRQANREKQLRHNQKHQRSSRQKHSKRRGRK